MLNAQEKALFIEELQSSDEKNDYQGIVKKIESLGEIDFSLAIFLARALINEYNRTGNEMCLLRSQDVLNTFTDEGHDDPTWLYLVAYCFIKQEEHDAALIRLERAVTRVPLNDAQTLAKINNLIKVCKLNLGTKTLSDEDYSILDKHIREHFGEVEFVEERGLVRLLKCTSHPDFNLLITKGLCERKLNVPQGVDPLENSRIELVLSLRKEWPLDDEDLKYRWPLELMFDLATFVRLTEEFVGFGYSFDLGHKAHPLSCFTGGMLTALGAFKQNAQEFKLTNQESVHFFEVIPLCPMEVAFRRSHSALDLLEIFKDKRLVISPLTEGRPDALSTFKVAKP